MFRHSRLALLAIAGLFLGAPSLLADDTASPIDPVEDQALKEESRAKYEEALGTFEKAFGMAVKEAVSAEDAAAAGRNRARAEAYLSKIHSLSSKLSAHRDTDDFLAGFSEEDLGPVLHGWARWHRAQYLRKAGRVAESREVIDGLGFVTKWWVIGPFDNERGRGMGTAMGPEGEKGLTIDFNETYQGKERRVEWRAVPGVHPYGWVDLNSMMRPNNQALAYACTWLRVDEATDVSLRLGSDEGLKVWVNGTEVLSRDIHRTGGFDQDVIGVRLAPGWNRVLLKVGENIGAWGFRMRVTTPEGTPLTDLATPSSDEELELATVAPETSAAADTIDAVRGAFDYLDEVAPKGDTAEEGSEDARAYFYLGLLHRARQVDDQKETQSDRKYFERAAKLRPDDPIYAFHAAESASRPIEMTVEKEENVQRRGREKAIEMDGEYAEAYYALADYYTNSLRKLPLAEELCRKAISINNDFLDAHLLLVDIIRRRGYGTEAEVVLREILERPEFKSRTSFLREIASHGNSEGLLASAADSYKRSLEVDHEDATARNRLADILLREGLGEDALGIWEERLVLNPFDVDASRRKAMFFEAHKRYAEAAAAAAVGLEVCPEDERLLDLQARAFHRLGDTDKSVAKWKEALRINPKNAVLKRYVEWLDPSFKPFELPYIEDAGTLLAGAKGLEEKNEENDPHAIVLDKAVTRVNPDGTNSVFRQKIVKILNNQGAKRNTVYFAGNFWAGNQAFEWRTARVWRKDGTVEEAQVQSGSPYLRWPRLQPGDAWEVQHRVDELRQSFFGDYFGDTWVFADQVPVQRSEYILLTPPERDIQINTRNMPDGAGDPEVTMSEDGKTRSYAWKMTELEKVRWEPAMPSWQESQPMVEVTTYKDWNQFTKWWWNLIKKQFLVDDAMKEKITELVAGKETKEEKIRAIYDYVVTDIQYQAWEFGVHGYKPYTATSIFHRQWGDCKDKAILIRTMLSEVDIEAYPVLIYADQGRSEEDLTLAQVGHFNHCIAWVPDYNGKGDDIFLDGTAQYNSMYNVPSMDRGATVLIVRPEGGEITTIPWNTPDEWALHQSYDIDLAADGSASVSAVAGFVGDFSVRARSWFSVEGKRELVLQQMLGPVFGKHTIESTEFPDLKDLSTPRVDVGLELKVDKYGRGDENKMSVPLKFLEMINLAGLTSLETREHDIVYLNPVTFSVSAKVKIPEGWKVSKIPDAKDMATDFGALKVVAEQKDGTVEYKRTFVVEKHRVSSDDYAEFRKWVTTTNNAAAETVVLERDTSAAATEESTTDDSTPEDSGAGEDK